MSTRMLTIPRRARSLRTATPRPSSASPPRHCCRGTSSACQRSRLSSTCRTHPKAPLLCATVNPGQTGIFKSYQLTLWIVMTVLFVVLLSALCTLATFVTKLSALSLGICQDPVLLARCFYKAIIKLLAIGLYLEKAPFRKFDSIYELLVRFHWHRYPHQFTKFIISRSTMRIPARSCLVRWCRCHSWRRPCLNSRPLPQSTRACHPMTCSQPLSVHRQHGCSLPHPWQARSPAADHSPRLFNVRLLYYYMTL